MSWCRSICAPLIQCPRFAGSNHSEKQRRQVLEAIDLFREKDTRDELGLAGIRDAISDKFFPGTSHLQTRARYFFFVPWIVQQHEPPKRPQALAPLEDPAERRLAKVEGWILGVK